MHARGRAGCPVITATTAPGGHTRCTIQTALAANSDKGGSIATVAAAQQHVHALPPLPCAGVCFLEMMAPLLPATCRSRGRPRLASSLPLHPYQPRSRQAVPMALHSPQVLDARYIIGLLNYQIQQGLVDPCGIVRQALRLLQPSDRGAQSFPIKSLFFLMFCSLVEPYYVAFCSADPRNLRDLVDFCVHRICYNYTAPPTGSEHTLSYRQYSSLCNMLRTCIHFHADLLLYIPQLLLKCPPPPRPPDPAKKRPAPSAGPPVGAVAPAPIADARPSPVSAPAHADWGASPKRQRTDVDSWVAVECDANCLAYPPKRKRPCHSTAAAARDAAPLPFQWFLQDVLRVRDGVRLSSLRRVRLLLRHARVSESQAPAPADQPPGPAPGRAGHCRLVQHLTARGVALPPSTTVALLDALLYHGSTAYVGGLLFLGDHAPHQLSATFHTVCGWAVRRAHISACAVLYGAELLALFPKRHLLQGLCEAHLHAHPIAFYLDAHSAPAADLQQPNGDGPTPGARV